MCITCEHVRVGSRKALKEEKKRRSLMHATNNPIYTAVINGKYEIASYLLKIGASPDFPYSIDHSKYIELIFQCDLMEEMTAKNIDVTPVFGWTLFVQVSRGNRTEVEFLVSRGVDVNFNKGSCLRLVASRLVKGEPSTMYELLFDLGADPNARGACALRTVMRAAVTEETGAFVAKAVRSGLDLKLHGRDVLHWALLNDQKDTLEYLLYNRVDISGFIGNDTFINCALMAGDMRTAFLLVHAGMSLAVHGGTAVYWALVRKNLETIDFLFQSGVSPNDLYRGRTILSMAIRSGSKEIVEKVIQYGAALDPTPNAVTTVMLSNNKGEGTWSRVRDFFS
jgi:ankyrin repeat protein